MTKTLLALMSLVFSLQSQAAFSSIKSGCKMLLASVAPPSSVQGLPFLSFLQMLNYYDASNPLNTFVAAANVNGPSFVADGSLGRMYVLGEDAPLQKLLGETSNLSADNYLKSHAQWRVLEPAIGKNNLLTSNGALWKAMHDGLREVFSPQSFKAHGYFEKILEIVQQRIQRLHSTREMQSKKQTYIYAVPLMKEMALEIFLRLHLGEKPSDSEISSLVEAGDIISSGIGIQGANQTSIHIVADLPHLTSFQKKQAAAQKTLHDYFLRSLKKNRELPKDKRSDFMNSLLKFYDENPELSRNDEEIVKNLTMFFQAANDTSGSVLSTILYQLARNPETQNKLYTELSSLGKNLDIATLGDIKYLDQLIAETFRFMPPVYMMVRDVVKDTSLEVDQKKLKLKKDDRVVACPFLAGRNPKTWGTERTGFPADQFHPDRFDPQNPSAPKPSDAAHYGFSRGPRSCIARFFATQQLKIILSTLVQNFEFSYPLGDLEPRLQSGTALSYESSMQLQMRLRNP